MLNKLIVLIYKRTHKEDPRSDGIFGIEDCMHQVRDWEYDAVIGIGGRSPWKGHEEIAYKINWIGISPQRHKVGRYANHVVTFEKFCLYEEKGRYLKDIAPLLHNHMYEQNSPPQRFVKSSSLTPEIYAEVLTILALAYGCEPSLAKTIEDIEESIEKVHNERKNGECKTICK